jgi:hypothetical protein
MFKITRKAACTALLSCLLLPPVHAEEPAATSIVVTQAWSRATPGGSKVAGGYLVIENKGSSGQIAVGLDQDSQQGRDP